MTHLNILPYSHLYYKNEPQLNLSGKCCALCVLKLVPSFGAIETPQHGNVSTWKCLKKNGNPSKTGFLRRFRNFHKKNGNPSKPSF